MMLQIRMTMALIAGANGANEFSTSNMYTSLIVNGCQFFSCVTYFSLWLFLLV